MIKLVLGHVGEDKTTRGLYSVLTGAKLHGGSVIVFSEDTAESIYGNARRLLGHKEYQLLSGRIRVITNMKYDLFLEELQKGKIQKVSETPYNIVLFDNTSAGQTGYSIAYELDKLGYDVTVTGQLPRKNAKPEDESVFAKYFFK